MLCAAACSWPTTRVPFPANRELLLDLFRTRHAIANLLGFATWADLATADQMIGSAANMKTFLDGLEQSTRAGAEREYRHHLRFREEPAAWD